MSSGVEEAITRKWIVRIGRIGVEQRDPPLGIAVAVGIGVAVMVAVNVTVGLAVGPRRRRRHGGRGQRWSAVAVGGSVVRTSASAVGEPPSPSGSPTSRR